MAVVLHRLSLGVTVVMCTGLLCAAVLVPAPPGALPAIAAVCIGGPLLVAWQARPLEAGALARLRRELDRLPETRHPLDL
jgi:hypothetical protein